MSGDVPMPARIAARPQYQGLPVPFTVPVVEGVPLFSQDNSDVVERCFVERLCGICGQSFAGDSFCAFISDFLPSIPETKRVFTQAPMHVDCARFAAKACPFLQQPHYDTTAMPEGWVEDLEGAKRELALYIVSDYRVEFKEGGGIFAIGTPPKKITPLQYIS